MGAPWHGDTANLGPFAWDSLWLGGTLMPGVWSIKVKKSRSVEKVKIKGSDGITLRDNGRDGASLTLTGRISFQSDWAELQDLWKDLDPEKPGATRQPLDIWSALPDLAGVRSVYIESLELDPPKTANDVLTVTIQASEWFPAIKPTQPSKKVKGFDGADANEWTEDQLNVPSATTGDMF